MPGWFYSQLMSFVLITHSTARGLSEQQSESQGSQTRKSSIFGHLSWGSISALEVVCVRFLGRARGAYVPRAFLMMKQGLVRVTARVKVSQLLS